MSKKVITVGFPAGHETARVKKNNNILDLKELRNEKHRDLVELVYYMLPSESMILYFYTLICLILEREEYLRFIDCRRVKNKTIKYLKERKAEKEAKKREEEAKKPKLSEEELRQKKEISDICSKWLKLITECNDAALLNAIYNLSVDYMENSNIETPLQNLNNE